VSQVVGNQAAVNQAGPNVPRAAKGVPDRIRTGSAKRRHEASVHRLLPMAKNPQPRLRAKIAPGGRAAVVVAVAAEEIPVNEPRARAKRRSSGQRKRPPAKAVRVSPAQGSPENRVNVLRASAASVVIARRAVSGRKATDLAAVVSGQVRRRVIRPTHHAKPPKNRLLHR
jgi:hypothetical protein